MQDVGVYQLLTVYVHIKFFDQASLSYFSAKVVLVERRNFFKWANPILFVYFCYFLDTISIIQIEKSVDDVLGIHTQGPQDGRRRRNHGAMMATKRGKILVSFLIF